ncbi:hypothetical protein AMJ80_00810 [bacterium SM23_31]|nr:MAG: hypothetical protein AMJ80_00810 [bacterium SM23_31]
MPAGDRTGPTGAGPMTGRAAGYCAGYSTPGYMNSIPGRGGYGFSRGSGRGLSGRGRGWKNSYWATGLPGWARGSYGFPAFGGGAYPYVPELTSKQETDMLKQEAELLKNQLKDVQNRINILEKAESAPQKNK